MPLTAKKSSRLGCRAVLLEVREKLELLVGSVVTPPATGAGASTGLVAGWEGARATRLSRREREVLGLLADGAGTDTISELLFISRNTVRAHVQRVITKLGAHSKLEAVAIARRRGLL